MLQTYIDGKLGDAERVIVEQHVADCRRCASLLRKQKRLSALLYETYAPHRLDRSLRQSVLSHLPEMQPSQQELTGLNQRAKHQRSWSRYTSRWALAAVVLMSLGFAGVLRMNWPDPPQSGRAIGILLQGNALARAGNNGGRKVSIGRQDMIGPETELETEDDGFATIRLAAASVMRMTPESLVHVSDERRIYVERGSVWLDVGTDGRLFRVSTPAGDVTVFGTVLAVSVEGDATVVTVGEGEVTVEQGKQFAVLVGGQRIAMSKSGSLPSPMPVDASVLMAWVKEANEDSDADALLCERLAPSVRAAKSHGMDSYVIPIPARCEVSSLCLEWTPGESIGGFCGYDVYVMDSQMKALLRGHVPGKVFGNSDASSHEITFQDGPRSDVHVLLVRLVPDTASGSRVARDLHVRVRVDSPTATS